MARVLLQTTINLLQGTHPVKTALFLRGEVGTFRRRWSSMETGLCLGLEIGLAQSL